MEIHIQIKLKGDGFPSKEELQIRNQLENLIEENRVGEIIDIGAGTGVMDIFIEVDNLRYSMGKIKSLVHELNIEEITDVKKLKKEKKKKPNYEVGDIIRLPVSNIGHFGYGHILIKNSPEIFVEFFKIVTKEVAPPIDAFRNMDWILKIYCGDIGITRFKTWKVIGNLPIDKNIQMPMFWHDDALTGKLYLRKDPMDSRNQKETTRAEIERIGAQSAGIAGYKAAEIALALNLKKAGLLK
jgi:hypothetical protein